MNEWHLLILSALFISCRSELSSVCQFVKQYKGHNTVAVRSTREESDETVTTISAFHVFDLSSDPPKVEVERTITECEGKDGVYINAVITDSKAPVHAAHVAHRTDKLLFYEKGAQNAVVSDDRTTVSRDNPLGHVGQGGILTNRPLNDNELFEVKLDRTNTNYEDTVGIGVTQHDPDTIDYPQWMSCGTIMLYDERIYEHGLVAKRKYGANLKTMKIGDRVGVMKKKNGDLHFFINGENQGLAKSNITYPVYGVLDVYGTAVQLSIVS